MNTHNATFIIAAYLRRTGQSNSTSLLGFEDQIDIVRVSERVARGRKFHLDSGKYICLFQGIVYSCSGM